MLFLPGSGMLSRNENGSPSKSPKKSTNNEDCPPSNTEDSDEEGDNKHALKNLVLMVSETPTCVLYFLVCFFVSDFFLNTILLASKYSF